MHTAPGPRQIRGPGGECVPGVAEEATGEWPRRPALFTTDHPADRARERLLSHGVTSAGTAAGSTFSTRRPAAPLTRRPADPPTRRPADPPTRRGSGGVDHGAGRCAPCRPHQWSGAPRRGPARLRGRPDPGTMEALLGAVDTGRSLNPAGPHAALTGGGGAWDGYSRPLRPGGRPAASRGAAAQRAAGPAQRRGGAARRRGTDRAVEPAGREAVRVHRAGGAGPVRRAAAGP